jgi:hypothetical protein
LTKGVERRGVARIELQRDGLRILHFRDDCPRVRSVGVIGENRVDPALREVLDDIAADAAASTRYDCDLARHLSLLSIVLVRRASRCSNPPYGCLTRYLSV